MNGANTLGLDWYKWKPRDKTPDDFWLSLSVSERNSSFAGFQRPPGMKSIAVVLNGASSSGKTSIARAMQRISLTPILHASLDTFTDMFYWPAIVGEESRQECHRLGVANFHSSLSILAANRFTLVIDHVFEQPAWFESCRDALRNKQTYFIGVHCPLNVLEEREKMRGDRKIGLAKSQFDQVHQGRTYALELDTSVMRADDCAGTILVFLSKQAGAKSR